MIDKTSQLSFQDTVWRHYQAYGRHDLPWRQSDGEGQFDPYKIMVSEMMLQQTQVKRVIPKYYKFLQQFPNSESLAQAELGEVLRIWSGLGYNRRAKFLHQAVQQIMHQYSGRFPDSEAGLIKLAGVGHATANAILAYAFNHPVVFLETNIRTVYIHHFCKDQIDISDKSLTSLLEQTVDTEHPREWYWALMDYGSHLKQTVGNLNQYSKAYSKQSKFEGSLRQIRGQVIRSLGTQPQRLAELRHEITDKRLDVVVSDLINEGLIQQQNNNLSL